MTTGTFRDALTNELARAHGRGYQEGATDALAAAADALAEKGYAEAAAALRAVDVHAALTEAAKIGASRKDGTE